MRELIANTTTPGIVTSLGALLVDINAEAASMEVTNPAPTALRGSEAQFRVRIDSEWLLIQAPTAAQTKWTILERGAEGSTAAGHLAGAKVTHELLAGGLQAFIEATVASQSVVAKDLGVIDWADVFANGPKVLYTMPPGSFLNRIKWTDTDFEMPAPIGGFYLNLQGGTLEGSAGVGTRKSFGWRSFTSAFEADENGLYYLIDTDSLPDVAIGPGFGYGPDLGLYQRTLVLSAAAGGPIEAAYFLWGVAKEGSADNGSRFAGIKPWQAKTAYDLVIHPAPEPARPQRSVITANGTIWSNRGEGAAAGESGAVEPNFAEHSGGEVADGPLVWADSGQVPTTAGKQHAVAEIWTPS